MRAVTRIGQLLLCTLVVVATGAERVRARSAAAATDALTTAEYTPAAVARAQAGLEATDAGAPLPFLAANESSASESLQTLVRAARAQREGERPDGRDTQALWNARATTRARAASLAYLEYALALFQRRAGIPTNHTTAPPHHHG